MLVPKLKENQCFVEVVSGVEGPCVYIGDEDGGHRLAGPKPWGGGPAIHRFRVDIDELITEAKKLKQSQKKKHKSEKVRDAS